jgi:hypothetical protein
MNSTLKRIGLIGITSLALVGGVVADARADRKIKCEMSGTWYPDNDSFAFVADYTERNGPDTFKGVYVNSSAGAVANVDGVASNGTWIITLKYTDAKHTGYEKHLVGQGTAAKNNSLVINGNFTAKKNGAVVQNGTFKLNGKCR